MWYRSKYISEDINIVSMRFKTYLVDLKILNKMNNFVKSQK